MYILVVIYRSYMIHIFQLSLIIHQFFTISKLYLMARVLISTFVHKLKKFNSDYPSFLKLFYCGIVFSVSDCIAQLVIQRKAFDFKRNSEFLLLGLGWFGPAIQLWYSHLLPKITSRYLSQMKKPKQILCRLAIDTLLFAPTVTTGYYILQNLFFRKSEDLDIEFEINEKLIPTLIADWSIWTPVNFLNFWYVPIKYQSLLVGTFTLLFNILLSYLSAKEKKFHEEIQKKQSLSEQERIAHKIIHSMHPEKVDIIA